MGWFTTFKEKFPTGKATFLQFRQWVEDVLNTVCNKTQQTVTNCYENTRMVFGTYNSPTVTYDLDKGVAEAFINLGFRPKAVSIWDQYGMQTQMYQYEDRKWKETYGGTAIDGMPCQLKQPYSIDNSNPTYRTRVVPGIEIVDNGFYIRQALNMITKDGVYVYTNSTSSYVYLIGGLHYFVAYRNGDIGTVASDGTFTINS